MGKVAASLGKLLSVNCSEGEGDEDDGPERDTWIRTREQERIGPSKWRNNTASSDGAPTSS